MHLSRLVTGRLVQPIDPNQWTTTGRPVEALAQLVDPINTQTLVFLFKTHLNLRCFNEDHVRII